MYEWKHKNRMVKLKKHPLPFIEELRDTVSVKYFSDLLKINDFVYSIVPSMFPVYEGDSKESIYYFYQKFKEKEMGGWCGLNTYFLNKILRAYGVECWAFNYGLQKKFLTHMISIVNFENELYLIDPFFNKHYEDKKGGLLTFNQLSGRLILRNFCDIIPVYGGSKKDVKYIPNPSEKSKKNLFDWAYLSPEVFESKTMGNFESSGLSNILKRRFKNNNPLLLMLIATWKENNLR